MNLRNTYEEFEKSILSSYGTKSNESKGRAVYEEPCNLRTEFQRDRDRIIHSKAFRRLKHKTQVFLSPEGDHYRTRLTHTLEVSQIARTIARALRLNEDLTEAIALGHDLGHTPFGHRGEQILNEICPGGFRHNEQSLRIVDVLERPGGLNLTAEVRDGILCHTGKKRADTLEGRIVGLADKIAYINHDIDDAIRGGVLKNDDLPQKYTAVLGKTHSERIENMIWSVINSSIEKPDVSMDASMSNAMMGLREFMFENVYLTGEAKKEEWKADGIIKGLFNAYTQNPALIPDSFKTNGDDPSICAKDYIAGMSDRYAVARYSELYIPRFWQG